MAEALGEAHYETFAEHHVLGELGQRTVNAALAEGESAKSVWHAVWQAMELPARLR